MVDVRGFTLLEVLVVLVLIAVVAGMVNLAAGPNLGRDARYQAQGLVALLDASRQQAVLEGRQLGIAFTHHGYQLWQWQGQRWQPLQRQEALTPGLAWHLEQDGLSVPLAAEPTVPHVLILSNDEYTAFNLYLESAQRRLLHIAGDGIDELQIDEG
ncbi:type II secretion system minor pseudopilin GspH [Pseudomonas abieticivorans]|uniref:type II secretion system minor pseudopilin GspH n=1 Tax=Pseudomonas abieticivorans TaxID=2931382 RepID=UPI0020C0276A|nr:type II secretion system minor pseudopilin GspH [Pseudomonas sp. PIA16]